MALNPAGPFIDRPVATALLTVAIALAGAVAFRELPIAPLPQIDFPTISVSANLPGASPEIMASSVATPLERQFGQIAGVTEMTSTSNLGSTRIVLQFDLDRDINGAARDVEAAINAAHAALPANLPANPTYRKANPADAPIMILALTSPVDDRAALFDAASSVVQQRLSQVEGVGQVLVGGSSLPAVRVDVNPTQLAGYGMALPDVARVLKSQNANLAKGQIEANGSVYDILSNDQLFKAAEYRDLVIGYHAGAAVKLSDVAEVTDSTQSVRAAGYRDGLPSVLLIIFRAPGANIIGTIDKIHAALPSLTASIPAAIATTVVLDRSRNIRASVADVERTLLFAVGLVILVVFLFLRSPRTTLIPSVAVPVSLIGTFGVMYLLDYSLDNLSLMALTISTGFVVDDAIVVIENVTRYLEAGMAPLAAAKRGAREIGFTVLSMSASLIAVFIPILLMGGIVGRLFREFAVTLCVAIAVSMVVSLTATPMMCAKLLKRPEETRHGRLYRASEAAFARLLGAYERTLAKALAFPAAVLAVLLVTIGLNVYLFLIVPKGFFPQQDNGTVLGGIRGAQDISFEALDKLTKEFVAIIEADPAVQNVMAFVGGSGATNGGFIYIGLKDQDKRDVSASALIDRLRPKLSTRPGGSVFLQAGQDVRIGGRQSNAQYQYTLQGETVDELAAWGPKLLAGMRKLKGLTDVNSDQQNDGLRIRLHYDRVSAARFGLTPEMIDNSLYDAFGQSLASTMYTRLNQYYVVLEVQPSYWQRPDGLKSVYLHAHPGDPLVPLAAVATPRAEVAPLAVNHQGQFPAVTLSFNLAPGVSLSAATQAIDGLQKRLGLPPTIRGTYSGTMEAFRESLSNEPVLIATALLAVYIVLGILYESFVHPITILSTLPSAGVGAVLALMAFKTDLSIVALIGVILLIGIVKKNAILMIDFAISAQRSDGKAAKAAIQEACMLRFRPILMTTLAALFGALPLAFGTGAGSELRRPLGIAIIGGLLVSQLLTLYTTPVVYLYLDRLRAWRERRAKGGAYAHEALAR